MTMTREVEKLRAELMNASNVDRRTGILSSDLFLFEILNFFTPYYQCRWLTYGNKLQSGNMVVPLETMRMMLPDILWDKMHMKIVMVFTRCVILHDRHKSVCET